MTTTNNSVLSKTSRLWLLNAQGEPIQLISSFIASGAAPAPTGAVPTLQADKTVVWSAGTGSGTVSQVNTGVGLTGGPITSTGTISLLAATAMVIGGVKPGTALAVLADGTLNMLPAVGATAIGGVKAGTNVQIAADGTLNVAGTAAGVTSIAANAAGLPRSGAIRILQGTNLTIVDNNDDTFTFNSTGGGISISVDDLPVTPVNNVINFVESTAMVNRIAFANTSTNLIAANFDAASPLVATSVTMQNTGAFGVTLDVLEAQAGNYNLFWPTAQGGAGQVLANDGMGNLSWITPSGGGGGGTFMSSAAWSSGGTSKNAYTSPGVINNQGITISLVASSGSGQITAATVRLNNTALSNTYATTGTWPNLTLTIPVADITGNAAQTANSVAISITGTFSGSGVNIAMAGTLTNVQPVDFAAVLNAAFAPNPIAYYQATGTVGFVYSITGTATMYGGTIGGVSTGDFISGTLMNFTTPTAASPIAGTVTGDGRFGAATGVVITLSSSMEAPSMYTPAFYVQTANNTVPTFTTASSQTTGAAAGSTITYPSATAATQYNWIATTRPLANIFFQTPFGNSPLVADVTSTQTIATVSFNVYGFTGLTVGSASVLVIT